jgi:hypothetical protein
MKITGASSIGGTVSLPRILSTNDVRTFFPLPSIGQAKQVIKRDIEYAIRDTKGQVVKGVLDTVGEGINDAFGLNLNKYFGAAGSGLPTEGDYADLLKRNDPQYAFDWAVQLPILSNPNLPNSYIERVVWQPTSIETSPVRRGDKTFMYPEDRSVTPITLEVYEDQKSTALRWFRNWQTRIYNDDGTRNMPYDENPKLRWKHPIILQFRTMKRTPSATVILQGCWPSSLSPSGVFGNESDITRYSVEINADDMKVIVHDIELVKGMVDSLGQPLTTLREDLMNSGKQIISGAIKSTGIPAIVNTGLNTVNSGIELAGNTARSVLKSFIR